MSSDPLTTFACTLFGGVWFKFSEDLDLNYFILGTNGMCELAFPLSDPSPTLPHFEGQKWGRELRQGGHHLEISGTLPAAGRRTKRFGDFLPPLVQKFPISSCSPPLFGEGPGVGPWFPEKLNHTLLANEAKMEWGAKGAAAPFAPHSIFASLRAII